MNPWTQEDIDQLAHHFYAGMSLKAMSCTLNRSTSALSKALTRFGIRPTNPNRLLLRNRQKTKSFDASLSHDPHSTPMPEDAIDLKTIEKKVAIMAKALNDRKAHTVTSADDRPSSRGGRPKMHRRFCFKHLVKSIQYTPSYETRLHQYYQHYTEIRKTTTRQWVDMDFVLQMLRLHGHFICVPQKIATDSMDNDDTRTMTYWLDHTQYVTAHHLVCLLNDYRSALQKQPLYVKGITAE